MNDYRFGKKFHLKNSSDFSYLRKGSGFFKSKTLRAYFKKSRLSLDETRIGFSVSKKVGKANRRNRLKRILRESFRQDVYRNMGNDIIFVVSPFLDKIFEDAKEAEKELVKNFSAALKHISECKL